MPSFHALGLPSDRFPSGFPTKLLQVFLAFLILATGPVRSSLLDVTTLTILWSSPCFLLNCWLTHSSYVKHFGEKYTNMSQHLIECSRKTFWHILSFKCLIPYGEASRNCIINEQLHSLVKNSVLNLHYALFKLCIGWKQRQARGMRSLQSHIGVLIEVHMSSMSSKW
jgi:hypothetical protein